MSPVFYQLHGKLRQSFESNSPDAPKVKMFGIFLARPASSLTKTDIIPHINDWHYRSRRHIEFFMAGYREDPLEEGPPLGEVEDARREGDIEIDVPGRGKCLYNAGDFDDFRLDLEDSTTWQYGGGCELLLANAIFDRDSDWVELDFKSTICCRLDAMKEDKAFRSVEQFIEKIIRFAEGCTEDDPTWNFSDAEGLTLIGSSLKRVVLSLLPKGLDAEYQRAEHFAVRDIASRK